MPQGPDELNAHSRTLVKIIQETPHLGEAADTFGQGLADDEWHGAGVPDLQAAGRFHQALLGINQCAAQLSWRGETRSRIGYVLPVFRP
jgi:hypothetical protein